MTREEALQYRKNCPYDAMGDYECLVYNTKKDTSRVTEEQAVKKEKTE